MYYTKSMRELWCFGIDGGGTYSRLALVNSKGEIRSQVEGKSTNLYAVSPDEVFRNLTNLLDAGLYAASLSREDLGAGCIGSAGLGRNEDRALFRDFFDRILGKELPVILCTDAEILLCGGLDNAEGYCLIAGTGSIALGRSAEGGLVRAGGFGYLLGDEGSAAWIGRTAISRALRSAEGRDLPTGMTAALLSAAGLGQSGDFIPYVHHQADKAVIASLAPQVTAAARQGDPLALDLLHIGAVELSGLVRSVREQSPQVQNKALVIAGGVLEHDEILRGFLEELLPATVPGLRLEQARGSALDGACMLARRALEP